MSTRYQTKSVETWPKRRTETLKGVFSIRWHLRPLLFYATRKEKERTKKSQSFLRWWITRKRTWCFLVSGYGMSTRGKKPNVEEEEEEEEFESGYNEVLFFDFECCQENGIANRICVWFRIRPFEEWVFEGRIRETNFVNGFFRWTCSVYSIGTQRPRLWWLFLYLHENSVVPEAIFSVVVVLFWDIADVDPFESRKQYTFVYSRKERHVHLTWP